MKKENEESLEQKALQSYAYDCGWYKSRSLSKKFGISAGIVFTIIMFFYLSQCSSLFGSLLRNIFTISFAVFFVVSASMVISVIFLMLADLHFLSKKNKKTIVSLLSVQDKKKIMIDYIHQQVKKSEKNIDYCKREIKPWQDSIDYHEQKIEKLQEELERS